MTKKLLKVIAGDIKRPVKIGDLELECYVLEDGTRVLSERGILKGLGMSPGGRDTEEKIPRYLRGQNISPYISEELRNSYIVRYGSKPQTDEEKGRVSKRHYYPISAMFG